MFNIIFDTQSLGLHVFWMLQKALQVDSKDNICKTGYFVSNRDFYEKFVADNPDFPKKAGQVLSEWEIMKEAEKLDKVDYEYIEKFEQEIGDATLWNAVICDRRFNYPVRAQFVQDYRPAYDQEFILKVLQVALRYINEHFDLVQPDAVISLNAVTLYDYLYYLIARKREIPYFQLKLTRVQNYVSLYTEPLDISPHIGESINKYMKEPDLLRDNQMLLEEVKAFVESAHKESLSYEGAISKNRGKDGSLKIVREKPTDIDAPSSAIRAARNSLGKRLMNLLLDKKMDPHYPSARQSIFYSKAVKPIRKKLVHSLVFNNSDREWISNKHQYKYAVYPLNTEPEVALLVYGRTYRNQIETVRNIAGSLPVGWKLVVKEHPNAIGYRSLGFYKKLRQIPNIVLLGPETDTNTLIMGSELVFVVFGTIGLEAILKKKPVIALSKTPYGSFPQSMVRYVNDLTTLAAEINELHSEYHFDNWALNSYLAAHIDGSIRINLFTELLGKKGRERSSLNEALSVQYKRLAIYTITRIKEEKIRVEAEGAQ